MSSLIEPENKHILDATCGSRSIWFDKKCPWAVFFDKRSEHHKSTWKSTNRKSDRNLHIEPDVIGDFTNMPFPDESFDLVVFDPPHLTNISETSWTYKAYGRLPEDWDQIIHDGFWECYRVLKPYGTLIFKWSEIQISTRDVIKAIGKKTLFGHRSGRKMNTHWMCYMKGI